MILKRNERNVRRKFSFLSLGEITQVHFIITCYNLQVRQTSFTTNSHTVVESARYFTFLRIHSSETQTLPKSLNKHHKCTTDWKTNTKPTVVVRTHSRTSSASISFIAALKQIKDRRGHSDQSVCCTDNFFKAGRQSVKTARAISSIWVKYLWEGNEQAGATSCSLLCCEKTLCG